MKSNENESTRLSDSDEFWLRASEPSLDATWDNSDDDIYAELLECDVDPVKP